MILTTIKNNNVTYYDLPKNILPLLMSKNNELYQHIEMSDIEKMIRIYFVIDVYDIDYDTESILNDTLFLLNFTFTTNNDDWAIVSFEKNIGVYYKRTFSFYSKKKKISLKMLRDIGNKLFTIYKHINLYKYYPKTKDPIGYCLLLPFQSKYRMEVLQGSVEDCIIRDIDGLEETIF